MQTNASALFLIQTSNSSLSSSYYNLSNYVGNYYTVSSYTPATVTESTSSYAYTTTTVTNQYQPSLGYSATAPLINASGHFYIEAPYTVTDDDGTHTEGGTTGYVTVTVATAGYFDINILGPSLSNFGVTDPLESPTTILDGSTELDGEGTTTVHLSAGSHTLAVSAGADTTSGQVVATINVH